MTPLRDYPMIDGGRWPEWLCICYGAVEAGSFWMDIHALNPLAIPFWAPDP